MSRVGLDTITALFPREPLSSLSADEAGDSFGKHLVRAYRAKSADSTESQATTSTDTGPATSDSSDASSPSQSSTPADDDATSETASREAETSEQPGDDATPSREEKTRDEDRPEVAAVEVQGAPVTAVAIPVELASTQAGDGQAGDNAAIQTETSQPDGVTLEGGLLGTQEYVAVQEPQPAEGDAEQTPKAEKQNDQPSLLNATPGEADILAGEWVTSQVPAGETTAPVVSKSANASAAPAVDSHRREAQHAAGRRPHAKSSGASLDELKRLSEDSPAEDRGGSAAHG